MWTRLAALCLAAGLVACGETAEPPAGDPRPEPKPLVLEITSAPDRPVGFLVWNGERQRGELGTHCWATRCVDFIGPPAPASFTEIPARVDVEVRGDADVDHLVISIPPKDEFGQPVDEHRVPVRDGGARLELAPGRYMVVVFATWPKQGDAVLSFGIDAG